MLPPHFSSAGLSMLTCGDWSHLLPGYQDCAVETKAIFPFLLAQLLFHEACLKSKPNSAHPSEMYCENTGLEATGIPPHVLECRKSKLLAQNHYPNPN
jgi:hypothetical protein